MNDDAIRARRDLVMTVICAGCENQYGAWRPRCPACGTGTPIKVQEQKRKAERARFQPRITAPKNQCTFCRLRGAKSHCPVCKEKVHHSCLGLHKVECEQFQRDVAAEAAKLVQRRRSV